MKTKSGGGVSIRVVSALLWSSHVSVRRRKSSLCVEIRSLIKKYLLDKDLTFNNAILVTGVCTQGGVTGGGRCFDTDSMLSVFACVAKCVCFFSLGLIKTGIGRDLDMSAWSSGLCGVVCERTGGGVRLTRESKWSKSYIIQ